MTGTEGISQHTADGVAALTIDRPAKKNALTLGMYEQLVEALAQAHREPSTRVILLSGAGGSFTAGNDLADFIKNPPQSSDSPVGRFIEAMVTATKPIVAAVSGVAIGVGTTMLLHCDLVYAAADARFQLPFARLGLCPEMASSVLLPRLCGSARASELLMLGERFDAKTAAEIGLVNGVVDGNGDHGDVVAHARAKALQIAALPPASIRLTKQLIRDSMQALTREALDRESGHFFERLRSPEAAEAMSAFMGKRAPDFSKFE